MRERLGIFPTQTLCDCYKALRRLKCSNLIAFGITSEALGSTLLIYLRWNSEQAELYPFPQTSLFVGSKKGDAKHKKAGKKAGKKVEKKSGEKKPEVKKCDEKNMDASNTSSLAQCTTKI